MFDDDYFYYNLKFPPTFFQPPESQKEDCEIVMKSAILNYLRSSCQKVKHHNAILNSGLTAGEAAMLHLQAKDTNVRTPEGPIYNFLCDCIKTHFGIHPDDYPNTNHHLTIGNVPDAQLEAKVRHCVKTFLQEINLKAKGYTFLLKTIVSQVREAKEKKLI